MGKITSCEQFKENLFLFLFQIINAYFVRGRFQLSICIHISMENTLCQKNFKKMVKSQNIVSQKQKTKK